MKKLLLSLVALVALVPSVAFANQTINFGASTNDSTAVGSTGANNQRSARSFVPTSNYGTFDPTLCIFKQASPTDNVLLEIQADSAGNPSGTNLGVVTVAAASLSGSCSLVDFGSGAASMTSGSTYWLVVERSASVDATNFYTLDLLNSGPGIKRFGSGSWVSLSNYDFYGSIVLSPAAATPPVPYLITFFDWF